MSTYKKQMKVVVGWIQRHKDVLGILVVFGTVAAIMPGPQALGIVAFGGLLGALRLVSKKLGLVGAEEIKAVKKEG